MRDKREVFNQPTESVLLLQCLLVKSVSVLRSSMWCASYALLERSSLSKIGLHEKEIEKKGD